jgi:hypothetical protein
MLVAMALVAAAVADPASPAAKSGAEPGFFCEYKEIEGLFASVGFNPAGIINVWRTL